MPPRIVPIKVPFRTHSELDHAAAELLRRYSTWKGSPARPPIDVEEIVEGLLELDFEVVDLREDLGMPDVLGATWFEDKRICVDESLEGIHAEVAHYDSRLGEVAVAPQHAADASTLLVTRVARAVAP
jgi:hypothetical protein